MPRNPHFAFPFARSSIDFSTYNPAETYAAETVVAYEGELYRAPTALGQNLVANPSFEDQTPGTTPPAAVAVGGASGTQVNLIPNPSGELTPSAASFSSSVSAVPANAIQNPGGEAGLTTWQSRAQNNDNLVNLVPNPSGETTPTVTSLSGSSAGPVNLIPNPSGEAGLPSGTNGSGSQTGGISTFLDSTAWAKIGTHSTRSTIWRDDTNACNAGRTPTGTAGIPVTPGNWYAARVSQRVVSIGTGLVKVQRCTFYWYTAAGAAASTSVTVGPDLTPAGVGAGSLTDQYVIGQAPADAAFVAIAAQFQPMTAVVGNQFVLDTDAYMVYDLGTTAPPSNGPTTNPADVPPYFDGSMLGWRWSGTANASTSVAVTATAVDSTVWARVGTHSSRYVANRGTVAAAVARVGNTATSVTPGNWYAARVSIRVDPTTTKPVDVYSRIYWFQSNGTTAASTASTTGPLQQPATPGTPYDVYVIAQAPADAAYGAVAGMFNPIGATANDPAIIVADLDAFALYDLGTTTPPSNGATTLAANVPAYHDGSMVGCTWNGTAHNSASTRNSFTTTDEVPPKFGTRCFRMMRDFDGAGASSTYIANSSAASRPLIVEGQVLALRCSIRAASIPNTARLFLTWYAAGDVQVGVNINSGYVADAVGSWTDIQWTTPPAPATTINASVRIEYSSCNEGEVHYLDGILAEAFDASVAPATAPVYVDGDMPGYRWSGTAHASTTLFAVATVVDTTTWSKAGSHASRYSVGRNDGGGVVYRTPIGTGGFPVVANNFYAGRVSLHLVSSLLPLTGRMQWRPIIYWFKSDGSASSLSSLAGAYTSLTTIGETRDAYLIVQAPADAAFASLGGYHVNEYGNQWTTVDIDAFQAVDLGAVFAGPTGTLTVASDVPPYFDGSIPGFQWNGAAHASTSQPMTMSLKTETGWAEPYGTKSLHYTAVRNDGAALSVRTGGGTGTGTAVVAGQRYGARVSVRVRPSIVPLPDTLAVRLNFYNPDGSAAITDLQSTVNPRADTQPKVYEMTCLGDAPPGATTCAVLVYCGSSTPQFMADIDVDNFMLSPVGDDGVLIPAYADGDWPGYHWTGTASNSISEPLAPGLPGSLWIPGVTGSSVNVVEQRTPEHVANQQLAVVLTPLGYRVERPDFGWEWPEFATIPLDLSGLRNAFQRLVPDSDANVEEWADIADAAIRHVDITQILSGEGVSYSDEATSGYGGATPQGGEG